MVQGIAGYGDAWTVAPTRHGFGPIADSSPVAFQSVLENESGHTVQITDVVLSCERCLSYTLSSRSIAPGDVALMDIRFDPLGYAGKVEFNIQVVTDHPEIEEQTIYLTADVRPLFTWAGDGAYFRELRPHEIREATLHLRPTGSDSPTDLLRAATEYPGLAARLEPRQDGSWLLHLRAQPPQPRLGLLETRVHLLKAVDQPPVYAVPILLEVVPTVNIAPNEILLDTVDREQFRILFVTQPADDPVELLDVLVPDDRFHAEIIPDYEFAHYRINVYAVSLHQADGFEGRIRLLFDRPDAEPIDLPVRVRNLAKSPHS